MRRLTRRSVVLLTAAFCIASLGRDGRTAAQGPPARPPLTNVTISLSENPAIEGETVTIDARATSRASGLPVPVAPGSLIIQACLDATTVTAYLPAAACNSAMPTGFWEDLNFLNDTPPHVSFNWPTDGQAGDAIGFRALYRPQGSRYAGGPSPSVDLLVQGVQPPPPPPPPPPTNCDIGGIYSGAVHDSANSYSTPLTIAVWHNYSCLPITTHALSYGCTKSLTCQTVELVIFLDTATMTFTGTVPSTVCSAPGICPTLVSGYVANGVLHFQYEPGQDLFFDGTFISS